MEDYEFEIEDLLVDADEESVLFPSDVIKDKSLPPCRIVNVVCTYNLGVRINLKKLSLLMRHKIPSKYRPDEFAAMMITVKANGIPQTVALLFGSSNIVHVGCRTEEHARLSAWMFCYMINERLGLDATVSKFRIRNMVSCFSVGHPVDLEALQKDVGARASYDPELIKSCRIRDLLGPSQVGIVYPTGKIVITGPKERVHIIRLYRSLLELCKKHKSSKVMTKFDDSKIKKRSKTTKEDMQRVANKLIDMEKKEGIVKKVNIENDLILGPDSMPVPYKRPLNPELPPEYLGSTFSFADALASIPAPLVSTGVQYQPLDSLRNKE
jgi:TATA-box binding protein (TBP) (component of TFIID and TFIIIB)